MARTSHHTRRVSKSAKLAQACAEKLDMPVCVVTKTLHFLAAIATKEVATRGKFNLTGLCKIKTKVAPAREACKKQLFGKMRNIKARPAQTQVKVYVLKNVRDALCCASW